MKTFAGIAVLAITASAAQAAEPIPFDSPRWQISAEEHRIEEFQGRQSLVLRGGLALIPDADFTDGVIEYLCAFPEGRAFVGATWRVQDAANREEFYIRPHQSGNPDANQYTPVINGLSAWQLYYGEGYGAPITYRFDTWFPVKIVVSGDEAEVFINDLDTPALFIDDLKREAEPGAVGLAVPDFGAARFADFRFERADKPKLVGRVERSRTARPGSVMQWRVSSPFAEQALEGSLEVPGTLPGRFTWTSLACEATGLANLSRVAALNRGANTVFATVTVRSEVRQVKTLSFGYSDRVRLYLNGRLLYVGDNGYRSRDYRYLGTIGYFDAVTLPLEKGDNQLWLAVSESFGGWGVQAAFSDTDGLTLPE